MDTMKILRTLFTLVGIALLSICVKSQIDTRTFLSTALTANGVVVDIEAKRGDSAMWIRVIPMSTGWIPRFFINRVVETGHALSLQ